MIFFIKISWSANNFVMHLFLILCTVEKTVVKGYPKAPFSIATTLRCRGGHYFFPWIYFTLETYFIILSVKQGGIKYHFFILWNWTLVSRAIGKHSTTKPMGRSTKLVTLVEGDPKAPFSIATTLWSRGEHSIPRTDALYPWFSPYRAECWARWHQVPFLNLWYGLTLQIIIMYIM